MSNTAIFIPARYGSTRYPGKPLCMLNDKPMIQHVAEACKYSKFDVYVLTDNKTIALAAKAAGVGVYIDTEDYANGTERCAGAVRSRKFDDYDRFINVQGDMPDVKVEMIALAAMGLKDYEVTTLYSKMPEDKQNDPNTVKMVRADNQALWFGRGMTGYGDWHLGVYGYTKTALKAYPNLRKEKEELVEGLEQLRWLKNSWQIGCYNVYFNGVEINSPEDVDEWHSHQNKL
jgi:3-deoxy-manno-octulosonate cytidylyltransferase (CMP-KDO synthetase)